MPLTKLITTLITFSALAQASSNFSFKPKLDADLSIYGFNADSTQVYAMKGGMRIGVKAEGKINDVIGYFGKMNIFFEQGSHTALLNDSYEASSTYGVEEGYIYWQPNQFTFFNIGVNRYKNTNSPIFISVPNIGAYQKLTIADYDTAEFSISANQNTVTTNSIRGTSGKLAERNPYYLTLNSDLLVKFSQVSIEGSIRYFSFERLNSDLADKSRYRGSSVDGSNNSSIFLHDYKGFDFSGAIGFGMIKLYGEFLKNTESTNTGKVIGGQVKFLEKYIVSLENIVNEADTLPSVVVNPFYGGTNREGFVGALSIDTSKYNFVLRYGQFDPKDANIYQDQLKLISFDLRYDI